MRCEEVDELAGPYALYALSPEELAEVERHLAGCEKHAELAELIATAGRLSALPAEMEPPPELKTRLMDAVREDLRAEGTGKSHPTRAAEPGDWLKRLFAPPRGYALGGLAAAVAAVVILAVVLVANQGGGGEGATPIFVMFGSDEISGQLTYDADEQEAVMTVEGLAPAPAGQTYQVWAITDGQPASIGFLEVPDDGEATSTMEGVELAKGQTVAVTLEPEGGSPLPTTDPILAVEI